MPATLRMRSVIALITLYFTAGVPVFGQTETATLSGVIQDSKGAVVPDVEVVATRIETGAPVTTKTNGAGIYFFTGLVPGHYHLMVRKPGFKEIAIKDFQLYVQDKLEQNFSLEIGSVSETVTVTASASNINTTDAAVSTVVDRQFVANIPLNGRSFQSLLSLAPGVSLVPSLLGTGASGEFSVNGQRTEANYFTVDGVSANTGSSAQYLSVPGAAGSLPGETATGSTQSLVSVDALQEVRINTSTYSAQYGRSPGGQFAFLTRSGTNDWHGSLFDYFRNEALDANNWFNDANNPPLPKPPERQNDFGGTLGGPIYVPDLYNGRGKTFFFFSYEGLRLQTPQPATPLQYPDSTLRTLAPAALQPFLNAFPKPNGSELGNGLAVFSATFSNPNSLDATSIRVDHALNDNFKVFGRYSDTPSDQAARDNGDLAQIDHQRGLVRTLTLGSTNLFGSKITSETRFNISWNNSSFLQSLTNFGGAVPIDLNHLTDSSGQALPPVDLLLFILNFGSGPTLSPQLTTSNQRQLNLTNSTAVVLGSHAFSFGGDYRRLQTRMHAVSFFEFGSFDDQNQVISNAPSLSFIRSQSFVPFEPIYNNLSLFAQDEWKVTHRLSLSLGVRWELNPAPGDAHGNVPYTLNQIADPSTATLAPKGTPLWKTTYGNFGPRIGIAYQLIQTPGHILVFRSGFGVFYDLGNNFASVGYSGVGYGSSLFFASSPFPISAAQNPLPPASAAPPYDGAVYAFDPHLKLPYILQWNGALEQQLGEDNTLTVSYVGSAGRRLLVQRLYLPNQLGNPSFAPFGSLYVTTNRASSDYDSLQVQFQRRLSHGLQALLSYTFAHSIDEASTNLASSDLLRSNSDFDIRHNFSGAVTYDIPGKYGNRLVGALLSGWSTDSRVSARSALPVDIGSGQAVDPSGAIRTIRADLVAGQPLYLNDSSAPAGRIINFNAFSVPVSGFGDAPRNFLRAFGAWQIDFGVRREFSLQERLKLEFRAEAFNVFNHPNFGPIDNNLLDGATLFGRATATLNNYLNGLNPLYQVGGPRSLQLALRLHF